jgi:hypothetical protein
MFLAPTAFVPNDVCRAEREVVGRLFNKGCATGPSGKKCCKYRGKWLGCHSLTGGPLITDKFRHAANDAFRQMAKLGREEQHPTLTRGPLQISGGAQLGKLLKLTESGRGELVDSPQYAISRPRHRRQTRLRPHPCGEVRDRKLGGVGWNRRCDVHPASVRSGLGRRVCPTNA